MKHDLNTADEGLSTTVDSLKEVIKDFEKGLLSRISLYNFKDNFKYYGLPR